MSVRAVARIIFAILAFGAAPLHAEPACAHPSRPHLDKLLDEAAGADWRVVHHADDGLRLGAGTLRRVGCALEGRVLFPSGETVVFDAVYGPYHEYAEVATFNLYEPLNGALIPFVPTMLRTPIGALAPYPDADGRLAFVGGSDGAMFWRQAEP